MRLSHGFCVAFIIMELVPAAPKLNYQCSQESRVWESGSYSSESKGTDVEVGELCWCGKWQGGTLSLQNTSTSSMVKSLRSGPHSEHGRSGEWVGVNHMWGSPFASLGHLSSRQQGPLSSEILQVLHVAWFCQWIQTCPPMWCTSSSQLTRKVEGHPWSQSLQSVALLITVQCPAWGLASTMKVQSRISSTSDGDHWRGSIKVWQVQVLVLSIHEQNLDKPFNFADPNTWLSSVKQSSDSAQCLFFSLSLFLRQSHGVAQANLKLML